jgi:6-phosphogluconolactonase
LFRRLAASGFDWSKVHVFWVDERCVPPDDDQSNYKLANETLLSPAKINGSNVHRIQGELDPQVAARRYVEEITGFFGASDLPEFDLIHRGMGPDAHTASLFPGDPLIDDRAGIAAAVWVEKMKSHRVTLLPGVLLKARQTVLQVAGADKAEALFDVLRGPDDAKRYPCQLGTRGSDRALWFVDKAAAAKL